MRILLIYPDHLPGIPGYKGYFYQGVASIASCLRKAGHGVKILHQVSAPDFDAYAEILREFSPAIIGISATSNLFPQARIFAQWSRRLAPGAVIVCGGIHATLNARQVIALPEFDLVCQGEGETPMLALARALEDGKGRADIPGMWWRNADGVAQHSSPPPPVADLDTLPWVDRDLWDYPSLQMESRGFATVMLSRGCHQRCTYCCNAALADLQRLETPGHSYFRLRSVASAIEELKSIRERYPFVKAFNFDDDNFFLKLPWAKEFTERYIHEIGLPFTCNLFPKLINAERVELLARAGCIDLRIGLESGNESIRKEVLGRNISDEDMRRAYRLCREAGIRTRSFVMVGLPKETPARVLDTVKFVATENIGVAQYSIFHPYNQTALHRYCMERGYLQIGPSGDGDYFSTSILDLPGLSRPQIRMFRSYFPVLVTLYRTANRLPRRLAGLTTRLMDFGLSRRETPYILNPLSGGLRIIKHLVPSTMNKNRIRIGKTAPASLAAKSPSTSTVE